MTQPTAGPDATALLDDVRCLVDCGKKIWGLREPEPVSVVKGYGPQVLTGPAGCATNGRPNLTNLVSTEAALDPLAMR